MFGLKRRRRLEDTLAALAAQVEVERQALRLVVGALTSEQLRKLAAGGEAAEMRPLYPGAAEQRAALVLGALARERLGPRPTALAVRPAAPRYDPCRGLVGYSLTN